MTLHAFIQYVKYRWKAKGRHGVHSPFVYKFIEDGLQKINANSLEELLTIYFGEDMRLIANGNIASQLIRQYADANKVVAIKNIHSTAQDTQQWLALAHNEQVKLSIDLFEYGLLFFNKEFKEKQHFVLKRQ